MTTITVNGEITQTFETTLLAFLQTQDITMDTTGVAVAVNSTLVVKSDWQSTTIQADDAIEIVKPFAGG